MATILPRTQERVLLHNVSWKTYECLLEDHRDRSAPRFAYDRGTLEIMSPSFLHETSNSALAELVGAVCDEWGLDRLNAGSTTFKREEFEQGFEPDSCFYIQNIESIVGAGEIDLKYDPAPDLVIEIDITSPSLDKLPLYAQIGVPEIWRLRPGDAITIFLLEAGACREAETSTALSPLSRTELEELMAQSRSLRRIEWLRRVRAWAREAAEARR